MSTWSIEYSDRAYADLKTLDRPARRQIIDRLEWLSEHFESVRPIPLHAEWKEYSKLRAGDWRAAYTFNVSKKIIKVHYIDHRSKMYKRRRD